MPFCIVALHLQPRGNWQTCCTHVAAVNQCNQTVLRCEQGYRVEMHVWIQILSNHNHCGMGYALMQALATLQILLLKDVHNYLRWGKTSPWRRRGHSAKHRLDLGHAASHYVT